MPCCSQISIKESVISGIETDHGAFLPYSSVTCAGESTFDAEGSCFVGSTGYAVQATDKAMVKITDVLLENHSCAAIRLDKDADVVARDCRIVGNTAVVAAAGQNMPVQVVCSAATLRSARGAVSSTDVSAWYQRNYDPTREEFYTVCCAVSRSCCAMRGSEPARGVSRPRATVSSSWAARYRVSCAICLRACYATSGTDLATCGTRADLGLFAPSSTHPRVASVLSS